MTRPGIEPKVSWAIGEHSNHHTNDRLIGLVGRVFANGPGDVGSVPGRVIPKTLKMVHDTALQYKVHISNIRYVSRV